jgi:hypothetical protein
LKLGYANVDQLQSEITVGHLVEWQEFEKLEPFSEERADWRAASIVQAVWNSQLKKSSRQELKKFLIHFGDSKEAGPVVKSWQHMKQLALMMTAAYGGRIRKRG